jgi:hypothetical protein
MRAAFFLISVAVIANAQQYPRWFLDQQQVRCGTKIVSVMRAPSLYKDSAVSLAFRVGCDLLAKYTSVSIRGGQTFWNTEDGAHSMGAEYTEQYDSSLADRFQSALKILDSFVDKQKTIVLAGDSAACRLDDAAKMRVAVSAVPQPEWAEKLPDDPRYIFGVGTSEEYYYESSSWQRAEHNALMAVARSSRSTVKSLQKKNAVESQDLYNEDIDVRLRSVEIVARWRDIKKKVFYVLARAAR